MSTMITRITMCVADEQDYVKTPGEGTGTESGSSH